MGKAATTTTIIVKTAWFGVVLLLFLFLLETRRQLDKQHAPPPEKYAARLKESTFKSQLPLSKNDVDSSAHQGHPERHDKEEETEAQYRTTSQQATIAVMKVERSHHEAQSQRQQLDMINTYSRKGDEDGNAKRSLLDDFRKRRRGRGDKKTWATAAPPVTELDPLLPSPETREKLQNLIDDAAPQDRFVLNESAEQYPTLFEWQNDAKSGKYLGVQYRVLSNEKPRAMLIEQALTNEESAALVDIANRTLTRSKLAGDSVSDIRTSWGMFINGEEALHPANQKLRQQAADLVGVNIANVEATQVLRYLPGQYYKAHPDYFLRGSDDMSRGGQRFATLLTWLNQPGLDTGGQGGETRFGEANMEVKPKKNAAVLFYSMDRSGVEDPYSVHEARPPLEGDMKWVAVCWIRQHRFA